jgi:hypothetical protein
MMYRVTMQKAPAGGERSREMKTTLTMFERV